jgi:subtilisin family serine protease
MRRVPGLATIAVLLVLPPTAHAAAGESVPNQLIVGFKSGTSSATQARVLDHLGGRRRRALSRIRAAAINPRSGISLDRLRKRLQDDPNVRYVEPDFVMRATKEPDDPQYDIQYALAEPGTGSISAPPVWDSKSSCTKVGVLDTGVQTDHPDLVDTLYVNPADKPDNNKDDDKNGWVDDNIGINLVAGKGDGEDDNGHGTHVSGIIAAKSNNGIGVSGTCWKGSIVPIKFMDSKGRGSTSDAADGIEYAIQRGLKIVNCSFGSSSKSSALQDAIDDAQDKGVLVVVAAGNDGVNIDKTPTYPASFTNSNILTVAASTSTDTLASFSNYGPDGVDVAAPGDNIRSTYLGSTYKNLDGTSMAAPYVAGAAALLKAVDSGATYSDLRTALRKKVDKPSALNGKVVYDGRLNLQKALDYIRSLG